MSIINFIKKHAIWHIVAIAIFFLISAIYFSPALDGYTIKQGDVTNWIGSSQEIKDYRAEGEEVFWTNSMFSGMPSIQISRHYNGFEALSTIRKIITLGLPSPLSILFLYFISFYILSIALKLKPQTGILGAVAFGLSSYFIIILQAGHNTKAYAIGLAPLVIAGFIWSYRSKKWMLPVAFSGLFMALELQANHLQITYYLGILLVGLGIVELIKAFKENKIPSFLISTVGLLVMYGLAIYLNYGNIKGTLDYSQYTTRGGSELSILPNGEPKTETQAKEGLDFDYITNWSYGVGESMTLLVPNYKGGVSTYIMNNKDNEPYLKKVNARYRQNVEQSSQYWGDQPFTSGPVYVGIIVLFLAILSLIYSEGLIKWALLAVTLLTLMLSWGKNFPGLTHFFIDYVPGYNKFRAVTIILAIVELTIPFLAVLFVNTLIKNWEKVKTNLMPFFIVSGAFMLILFGFYVAPTVFNDFISMPEINMLNSVAGTANESLYIELFNELETVRIEIFKADVLRSILFFIIGAAVVFIGFKNETFAKKAMAPILTVFILIDLISVDTRYLSNKTTGKEAQWVEKWKQQYPFNAAAGDLSIYNMEMSNPAIQSEVLADIETSKKDIKDEKVSRAQSLRMEELAQFRSLGRHTHFRVLEGGNPYNNSRTSYYHKSIGGYHGAKLSIYQDLIEFHLSKNNRAVLDMLNTKYIMGYGGTSVEMNPTALGNAWFVKNVNIVDGANEEIMALSGQYIISNNSEFQLLVNNKPIQSTEINGIEDVNLVINNGMTNDTMPIQLPVSISQGTKLSFAANAEGGAQWVYGVDSTMIEILTFESKKDFAPAKTAVMRKEYSDQLSSTGFEGNGQIKLESYNPNKMVYHSSNRSDGLAVFSEIFYPVGWSATIDGEKVDILRANYVLRALEVPAGEHTIEFTMTDEAYETSNTTALFMTFLILVFIAFAFYWDVIRKEKEVQTI